jgi:hypothetical protein
MLIEDAGNDRPEGGPPVKRIISRPNTRSSFPPSAGPLARLIACGLIGVPLVSVALSCGAKNDSQPSSKSPPSGAFLSKKTAPADTGPKTPDDEITAELSKIITEAGSRYASLEHEYDEHLLAIVDRAEDHLSGRLKGPAPRAMPKLSEQEEYDHLRETIRRWRARTGKDLRAEIDKLKAEVAARKPGGPVYHPEFHKRFAAVFDDFIPIEVEEIRERRNRVIHERARPILEKYRETAPASVKRYETTLNTAPYKLPESSAAPTEAPPNAVAAEPKGK